MKKFTFRLTPFDRLIYFLLAGMILLVQGVFVYVLVIYAPRATEKTFEDLTSEFPILLYAYIASWFVTIITVYSCLAYTVVRDNSSLTIDNDQIILDRAGPPPFSGLRKRRSLEVEEIQEVDLAGISLFRPGKKKLKIRAGKQRITIILDDLREIDGEKTLPSYKGIWRHHPLVVTLKERMTTTGSI